MNKTRNDLSYNRAELDYQALLSTSQIAYSHCLEEIGRYLAELRSIKLLHHSYLTAQWLAREAEHLVIAAETMDTLLGGLKREEIVIVNKEG